ncbi:MAG: LysE family translocator [Thermomicrobiales bacterium]
MLDAQLIAFIGVAVVLIITPGADLALITAQGIRFGRSAAMSSSAGILCGLVVHATLAALGLSAILARSATVFEIVKLAGATYLIYLGAQALWAAFRQPAELPVAPTSKRSSERLSRSFSRGILSNVLNPKVSMFYLTFLPQFISPGDSVLWRSLMLSGIHLILSVIFLIAYVLLLDRVRATLLRPLVRHIMEGTTGVVLVALGLRLAWTKR